MVFMCMNLVELLSLKFILGNLTCGCLTAGEHFNPYGNTHGSPLDQKRHVGDLGNIQADESGRAYFKLEDHLMMLYGNVNNVIGRAIVVHEREDDLGCGGNEESLKTGNAGSRIGCGVIALSGPFAKDS